MSSAIAVGTSRFAQIARTAMTLAAATAALSLATGCYDDRGQPSNQTTGTVLGAVAGAGAARPGDATGLHRADQPADHLYGRAVRRHGVGQRHGHQHHDRIGPADCRVGQAGRRGDDQVGWQHLPADRAHGHQKWPDQH